MTEFVKMRIPHYINRLQEGSISRQLFAGRVIVISGPRRVGKTTLLKQIVAQSGKSCKILNGEDLSTAEVLERRTVENYRSLLSDFEMLVVDEAQHIPEIGLIAKLIHDELPEKQVILSGSSNFDLVQKTGEPLTGRKRLFELLPFAEAELWTEIPAERKTDQLRQRLVYGNYPEIFLLSSRQDKEEYLRDLRESYLMKDILKFENLKSSDKVMSLLRLVALQVGSELSYLELGKQLGMSKNTVEKYLDLLSKAYVVYRIEGFSRKLRKEISKSSRWYFYDNGIMNIVANNLDDLAIRNDTGRLWVNYVIGERLKHNLIRRDLSRMYFWRTYDRQEIDLIEERGQALSAYEMKWKERHCAAPRAWANAYPDSTFQVINPENFHSFVGIG